MLLPDTVYPATFTLLLTITCTCARTTRTRPPSVTSHAANVDRYLEAASDAGIAELGVSEHIHRFKDSLELWRHDWWELWAHDDLGAYCDFVRTTPLRLGIEMDYLPGREDRTSELLDRTRLRLRDRVGAFHRRRGGRPR